MKTQFIPYQKLSGLEKVYEKTKGGILGGLAVQKGNIVLLLITFLLGRVSLFDDLMPFGMAFYAASAGSGTSRILLASAVILGMLTGGAVEELYVGLMFLAAFTVIERLFKNKTANNGIKHSLIGLVSIAASQLILVSMQGFLMYDVLRALLYTALVFSLIFIFKRGLVLIDGTTKNHELSSEEIISGAMLAVIALTGFGDMQIAGASLTNVFGILAVMLFSFKTGPAVGSAVGVIVGLVITLSNPVTPLIIGTYGFCGLLSGVFRNLGKIGAGLGFIIGNAMLTLYINGSTEVFIYIKDIIFAAIIFTAIPQKIINNVMEAFAASPTVLKDKASYSERIKELTVERLNNFAKAFQELSKTFDEISQTQMVTTNQDISSLFDRVADNVCKDCSLCLHCWDRNFYNTYQVMFKVVESLEKKGWIEQRDIPQYFMERCERIDEFVKQVNNVYELFKVDMSWKNKMGESRGLISQQLDGLSNVISNLALEINNDIEFKGDLEERLLSEFENAGVKVKDILVYKNKWEKFEVNIFHKGCAGSNKCLDSIEKMASSVLKRRMIKDRGECMYNHKLGACNLKLVEEEVFSITTGVARREKHDSRISGDNYTFMNIGDGKHVLALSDGMGTGQRAFNQSKAAIGLLEQFMETGFDKDTAIRLINSILVLKSDDDSFATIDLCAVDLYDGKVEFVKIGAVPTFIKRPRRTEVIRTVSLPVGILSNIETELVCKNVDNGDFIIMVSDGIIDSFKQEGEEEQTLIKFIEDIDNINPQAIADSILSEACSRCGGKPLDDMTVLVAKIWKR
ncbi:MAG: stage II sporulation protein E [Clostridium sp.]|jgi:stage II sporulation protein E|nr:stage II sporulation protein E [Clostridium sp.]